MRFQNASIKNENPYLLKQISGAPDITQGDQVYQAVTTGEAYLLFTIYHPCPSLPPGEVCMGPPPDQRNLHVIVRESGMSTPTAFPYPPEEIPTVPWQPKNVSQVEIQTVGEYSLEQVANQLLREWFYQYSDPRADENWKIQSFSISKINIQEIPTVEPDQIENYAVHIESSLMPVNRTVSAWNSLEGKPEPGDWISFTEDVKLVKTATFFRLMIPFPK
jgi:hypothetical protein